MKRIGILGGMSATSTQLYYASLCELTQQSLGGLNSPELLIRSVNFDPIAKQMEEEARRQKLEALKAARAQTLNTEDASTPLDVENDSVEEDEGIEDDSEKVFQRKPL